MHDRADNILQTLAEVYQIEGTFCENGCASLHHHPLPAGIPSWGTQPSTTRQETTIHIPSTQFTFNSLHIKFALGTW